MHGNARSWIAIVTVFGSMTASSGAAAQASDETRAVAASNAAGPPLLAQYDKEIARGIEAVGNGMLEVAGAAFTAAKLLRERAPAAHYYAGELARRTDNYTAAIASFEKALEYAVLDKDADMHMRALAGMAVTLEHLGEIQRAREVWVKAVKVAEANPGAPLTSALVHAHIQAIDLVFEREHVYIGVRQRISDREKITGRR